jgi:hypothetical protein
MAVLMKLKELHEPEFELAAIVSTALLQGKYQV